MRPERASIPALLGEADRRMAMIHRYRAQVDAGTDAGLDRIAQQQRLHLMNYHKKLVAEICNQLLDDQHDKGRPIHATYMTSNKLLARFIEIARHVYASRDVDTTDRRFKRSTCE
jgi:hypothetical protein